MAIAVFPTAVGPAITIKYRFEAEISY